MMMTNNNAYRVVVGLIEKTDTKNVASEKFLSHCSCWWTSYWMIDQKFYIFYVKNFRLNVFQNIGDWNLVVQMVFVFCTCASFISVYCYLGEIINSVVSIK